MPVHDNRLIDARDDGEDEDAMHRKEAQQVLLDGSAGHCVSSCLLEGVPPGVWVNFRSGGMLRRVLVENLAVAGADQQDLC